MRQVRAAKAKIVLLTGSHLCNNPRAVKEADALSEAGFEVEVLGWNVSRSQAAEDRVILASRAWRFTACLDFLDQSPLNRLRHARWSIIRRAAYAAAKMTRVATAAQLGAWRRSLHRSARTRAADLFIAHSAVTMWVARELRRDGRRIGVDMEDWFSREHPHPGPGRVIAQLEKELLAHAAHSTCTSTAMSNALAGAYGCAPPTVIYNAFAWSDRSEIDGEIRDRRDRTALSIHWYSQTLGPGRGLEDLFAALELVRHPVEVHLRGTPVSTLESWLANQLSARVRKQIFIHPQVSNRELLSRIAEHDIGFAGETNTSARALTITNKILQYLLAGLAVVASDTPGQREVAAVAPRAVSLYETGNPSGIANAINRLAEQRTELEAARFAAIAAAEGHFCWERIKPRLLDAVSRALEQPSNPAPRS